MSVQCTWPCILKVCQGYKQPKPIRILSMPLHTILMARWRKPFSNKGKLSSYNKLENAMKQWFLPLSKKINDIQCFLYVSFPRPIYWTISASTVLHSILRSRSRVEINNALQAINPDLKIRTRYHAVSGFQKGNFVKRTIKSSLEARPTVPNGMLYRGHSGSHQ